MHAISASRCVSRSATVVSDAPTDDDRLFAHECSSQAVEFHETPLRWPGAGKVLKRELREPFWKGMIHLVQYGDFNW